MRRHCLRGINSKFNFIQILVPYRQCYILFVFSLDERTVTLLDPNPEPEMYKPGVAHKYNMKLKEISFYLNIALADAIKGWKDDVFLWRRITPIGLPINHDRLKSMALYVVSKILLNNVANNNVYFLYSRMSGFFVLTYMRWWNGKEAVRANGKVGIDF